MAVTSALGVSSRACLASYTRPNAVASVTRPISKLRVAPVVAFRDNKRSGQDSKAGKAATSSKQNKKKPVVQPLAKAPTNSRENAESVLWFVAVAGLFLTGVLFVTIPAFQVGGNALTQSWQKGVNKSAGIKEPGTYDKGYAPGPGPAAAPESPAAQM